MSTTIDDRAILILRESGEPYGFYTKLEQLSGIAAQRWRNLLSGRQKATGDMIEALGKIKPNYAFWLITGVTDAVNGHVAPGNALTFPERLYAEQDASLRYFRQSLELANELSNRSSVDVNDREARLQAYERKLVGGMLMSSGLAEIARELAASDSYSELQDTLQVRETERAITFAKVIERMPSRTKELTEKSSADAQASKYQSPSELFWRSIS